MKLSKSAYYSYSAMLLFSWSCMSMFNVTRGSTAASSSSPAAGATSTSGNSYDRRANNGNLNMGMTPPPPPPPPPKIGASETDWDRNYSNDTTNHKLTINNSQLKDIPPPPLVQNGTENTIILPPPPPPFKQLNNLVRQGDQNGPYKKTDFERRLSMVIQQQEEEQKEQQRTQFDNNERSKTDSEIKSIDKSNKFIEGDLHPDDAKINSEDYDSGNFKEAHDEKTKSTYLAVTPDDGQYNSADSNKSGDAEGEGDDDNESHETLIHGFRPLPLDSNRENSQQKEVNNQDGNVSSGQWLNDGRQVPPPPLDTLQEQRLPLKSEIPPPRTQLQQQGSPQRDRHQQNVSHSSQHQQIPPPPPYQMHPQHQQTFHAQYHPQRPTQRHSYPQQQQQYGQYQKMQRPQYAPPSHHQGQRLLPPQQQQHQYKNIASHQQRQKPLVKNLFQKLNQGLDKLADLDTIVSSRTKKMSENLSSTISNTASHTANNIVGGVSGTFGNIKNLGGKIGSRIGGSNGAPTSSTELGDEWEIDRRETANKKRLETWQKRFGVIKDEDKGGGSGSGGAVVSPLHQHLSSLASKNDYNYNLDDSSDGEEHPDSEAEGFGSGVDVMDPLDVDVDVNTYADIDLEDDLSTIGGDRNSSRSDVKSQTPPGLNTNGGGMTGGGVEGRIPARDLTNTSYQQRGQQYGEELSKPSTWQRAQRPGEAKIPFTSSASTGYGGGIGSGPDPSNVWNAGVSNAENVPTPRTPIKQQKSFKQRSSWDNDDDYDTLSFSGKISRKLGSIIPSPPSIKVPKLLRLRLPFRSNSSANIAGWSDDEDWPTVTKKPKPSSHNFSSSSSLPSGGALGRGHGPMVPVADLLDRRMRSSPTANKSTGNLLSSKDMGRCTMIGRGKALFDVIGLGFILLTIREIVSCGDFSSLSDIEIPQSLRDLTSFLRIFWRALLSSNVILESWAPFALTAAVLTSWTNGVVFYPVIQSTAAKTKETVESNVLYSQMYLRLVSGLPLKKPVQNIMSIAASKQVMTAIAVTRLKTFVSMVTAAMMVLLVAVVKPMTSAIFRTFLKITSLEGWTQWPIPIDELMPSLKVLVLSLVGNIRDLLMDEFEKVSAKPISVLSKTSLFAVLFLVSMLPSLERNRASSAFEKSGIIFPVVDEEEDADAPSLDSAVVSDMGISSSSRLGLLSQDGGIENVLERWKMMQARSGSLVYSKMLIAGTALLRRIGYAILCNMLMVVPLILYSFVTFNEEGALAFSTIDWNNVTNMVALLICTQGLAKNAVSLTIDSARYIPFVGSFLNVVSGTVGEVSKLKHNPQADLQLTATASPSKGIVVSNLWAAHVAKRAWACRGANIFCSNGEVVAILGDDSSGKTRLLAAIGESIILPPKSSRSTTTVRGTINVGGVDISKWERTQLKQRFGIMLNDVRTVSDASRFLSGASLEEIFEPTKLNRRGSQSAAERDAIGVALKLTGLSSSLLPKLQSKLSTVVTANEDELMPSPLRPPSHPLTPSEWSKVVLTKILAQTIFCNDNPMSSPDSITRCMLGSILLLDDATAHMSEIEEAKFIRALQRSGAATLLTSKRWAIGRFVDRIVVVRDGTVIESGSHPELLARGAQRSIYAAKWVEMTSE